MRFTVSKRILGIRLSYSFGGRRGARVSATERLGRGVYVTESKTLGKRKR